MSRQARSPGAPAAKRSAQRRAPRAGLAARLAAPGPRRGALIAMLAASFLMGGGARADIISLVVLRPLAFIAAGYALAVAAPGDLARVRAPLIFLALLAGLIALHQAPLPAAWWSALPSRSVFAEIYAAAGIDPPWLPLSTSPARGLNALLSLSVPLAVLLLFAVQEEGEIPRLLSVIWFAIVLSVLLGVLQLLGSENGPAYLYRITNNGLPVGLFANRNHQALAVAFGILLSGYAIARSIGSRQRSLLRLVAAAGAIMVFVPFLLVAGSRGGLIIGSAMMGPAAYLVYSALEARMRSRGKSIWRDRRFRVGAIATIVVIAALVAAAIAFSRSLAFDRLLAKDIEFDLRAAVLPTILALIRANWLTGIGFGSFEAAFAAAEPLHLLKPSYLNHAHNDWIEFGLEAGAAGAILLAGFAVWLVTTGFKSLRIADRQWGQERFTAMVIMLSFAVFSVFDYPLRVPSLMAVAALACGILARTRPTH